MPLDRLTWVICDSIGKPLPGGHVATDRRLVAARNRSMEARLKLGLHDEVAVALFQALREGIPQLRVYLGTTLVFAGYWTPMRGSNSTDSPSSLELTFKDGFSRLAHRYTDAAETYTQVDAGLIAANLIDDSYAEEGEFGILTDSAWVEPTMLRDRTYDYKNIAEAITELTEVLEGFDWFPVYIDSRTSADGATMEFHVAASYGVEQPTALFEFGEGTKQNCTGYSFTTGLPITSVRAFGAGGINQTVTYPAAEVYGVYMDLLAATDVSEPLTLVEKAHAGIRISPAHVTEFKPDPAVSPLPWRDFWVGDTIFWNVDDGAMQQQEALRVQSIEVAVDDSDNISDLVVGIDPLGADKYLAPADSARRYVQKQQDIVRRLSALER